MRKNIIKILALFGVSILMALALLLPSKAGAAGSYNYDLTYQSPYPATMEAGATTNVYIELKNTGSATWNNTGSNIVRLGSGSAYGNINQKRDYDSEFANTDWLSKNRPITISKDGVQPGEVTRFQFNIKVPNTPGVYKAYFTPVVDGYAWMKDIGIYWQITVKDSGLNPVVNSTINASQTVYQSNEIINGFASSVVKIICKASADYWNQGSGTLYHNTNHNPRFPEYYIMTNLHVVETADFSTSKCDIRLNPEYGNTTSYLIFESEGYRFYGDSLDFAIIEPKINPSRKNAGTPADLARYAKEDSDVLRMDSLKQTTGDKIYVFGYPENGSELLTEGFIVSYETYQDSRYIDAQVSLKHGNSGGLAVNSYGHVLGIPTFIKDSQSIGMILDMDYLMNRILN